jgi:hypothetical protein
MGSFGNFPQQNSIETPPDITFGINGVWVSVDDPKGTVRIGNIKIDEHYGADDLRRLEESVENNFSGKVEGNISSAVKEYQGYISTIRDYLNARTAWREEIKNKNK